MEIDKLIQDVLSHKVKEHLNQNIELKSSWHQDHGKKISALCNKINDGKKFLIIGVADDGVPVKNNEAWLKQTEEQISQHLNQYLDPVSCIHIFKTYYNDNESCGLIILELINPGAVVYWNKNAYKAVGTTKDIMEPDEILALSTRLPGTIDITSQRIESEISEELVRDFAELCEKRTESFFKQISHRPIVEILNTLSIYKTKTTQILFGEITARYVVVNENNEVIVNKTVAGLYKIINDAFFNEINTTLSSLNRKIRNSIPVKVLKETLANAVAHAAYYENNGEIIIEVYPDKIIVGNLALPESGFYANKWFSRSHKTYNRLLMETLRVSGVVDELGRGKNIIYSELLKNGNKPPEIYIEKAGRFSRWNLCIYVEGIDKKILRLYDVIQSNYATSIKSQMAFSLVLWKGKPVSEIKKYIDGESEKAFLEIINDLKGPVFYWQERDEIVLRRWARLIIEEGRDTKKFTSAEEQDLIKSLHELSKKYWGSFFTLKQLREFASIGDTPSAIQQSCKMVSNWEKEKIVKKIKKGEYKFIEKKGTNADEALNILKELLNTNITKTI